MHTGWDTSVRRPADVDPAIRSAVRRRAHGRCQWHDVTHRTTWLYDAPQCPSYGVEAVHYDDGPPVAWAWLCGPHATEVRRSD